MIVAKGVRVSSRSSLAKSVWWCWVAEFMAVPPFSSFPNSSVSRIVRDARCKTWPWFPAP